MRAANEGQSAGLVKYRHSATCRTSAPEVTKGLIIVARALANWGGYSAVVLLRKEPSGRRTPTTWPPGSWRQERATEWISGPVETNIYALAQSLSNMQAQAWAANGAIDLSHWYMCGSSQVILVDGFSRMTIPSGWSTGESRIRERSCIVALSWTDNCCWNVLGGRPSKCSGVRSGAGPSERSVAQLCLLQYGAARAAPMRPEDARRSNDSKRSSARMSCLWIKSMCWTRSPWICFSAVLTGTVAPKKCQEKSACTRWG